MPFSFACLWFPAVLRGLGPINFTAHFLTPSDCPLGFTLCAVAGVLRLKCGPSCFPSYTGPCIIFPCPGTTLAPTHLPNWTGCVLCIQILFSFYCPSKNAPSSLKTFIMCYHNNRASPSPQQDELPPPAPSWCFGLSRAPQGILHAPHPAPRPRIFGDHTEFFELPFHIHSVYSL